MTHANEKRFDVVVVGTGTAGTVSAGALRAAGRSVAIVDERPFGGTCALRGCDPKKVLVQAAELLDHAARMQGKGASGALFGDWPALMQFKSSFTDPVPASKEKHLAEQGIEMFHGHARFVSESSLDVAGVTLRGEHIVIATGARPMDLGFAGHEHVILSDAFLELATLPSPIVFVGGGYISFEFAHVAARFGAEVHIVHGDERPLAHFEPDLVDALVTAGEALGIHVHVQAPVDRVERTAQGYRVHAGSRVLEAALVVHGAGRVPNVVGLELARANVATANNGGIVVDTHCRSTTNPRVYAAGDVAASGHPALTPVSSAHAHVVAENILHGDQSVVDLTEIPTVVFSIPPLASVGLTEAEAKKRGVAARVHTHDASGWYSTRSLGAALARTKILTDEDSGKILGAHLLGPHAAELVNVYALAIRAGMTADALTSTTFAYPSSASDLLYMI